MKIKELPARLPEIHDPRLDQIYLRFSTSSRDEMEGDYKSFGKTIKKIARKNTRIILEAACGAGHLAYYLAKNFPDAKVIAEDISNESIESAKTAYQKQNLEFQIGDVYTTSERHKNLDLVVVKNSLHHFDLLERALKQIYQSLSPGGVFMAWDIDRTFLTSPKYKRNSLMTMLVDVLRERRDCIGFLFPSEKSVVESLFREKAFDRPNVAGGIVTAMSLMASYTPEEVETALKNTGFSDIILTSKAHNYGCHARK